MARISKDPEERRQELIDTAMRLFLEKGYEQTSVSDIVKEINVAQGTFYYHFKSKTDILEAVGEKFIDKIINKIQHIANRKRIDEAERLDDIIDYFSLFYNANKEIVNYIHSESNIVLHQKLGRKTLTKLLPILTKVIEEGVEKGRFNVTYPAETAEFLILAMCEMLHQPNTMTDVKRRERVRYTIEENLKRILGVEDYTFELEL